MTTDEQGSLPAEGGGAVGGRGLSFGFSKKSVLSKKLQDSGLRDKSTLNDDEEKDFVKEVNLKRGLESSKPKTDPKKKALVIPCQGNKYKFDAASAQGSKAEQGQKKAITHEDDEEAAAAQELVADSKRWLEGGGGSGDLGQNDRKNENVTIALSQEEKEKAALDNDLDSRAEVSTLADYDEVPVQGFGLAVLRGMGFKPGEGIGGFKKAAVQCIEPDIRPKGLGLGAQRPNVGGSKDTAQTDGHGQSEDLSMKTGALVLVERGAHKGCYGKVEGLDEETARVVVKLSVGGGDAISISENIVKVVGKDEYKKYSKVINKDQYDKYAEKQRDRQLEWDEKKNNDSKRKRSRSRSPIYKSESRGSHRSSSSNSKGDSEKPSSDHHRNGSNRTTTWLRPQLRVRLIDEDFKNGKYYNTKVVVEDVVSPYSCVVRTDTGRLLDNVDPRECETIVPKQEMAVVMIVHGKRKGKIAEIVARDKLSSTAAVQLLPDKDQVLKMDYNDICEFVGDVDMYI